MSKEYTIRVMTLEDYDEVYALWMGIHGFGIRSIDDSKEGVERFLKRNPTTSMVAVADGKIVGAILCGHDGRRGCLYHVCVHEDYRKNGIGKAMAVAYMRLPWLFRFRSSGNRKSHGSRMYARPAERKNQ